MDRSGSVFSKSKRLSFPSNSPGLSFAVINPVAPQTSKIEDDGRYPLFEHVVPNLRLEALADKLSRSDRFCSHGGEPRVYASTVWPSTGASRRSSSVSRPRRARRRCKFAVEEALELLHEDYAYEFQIAWSLWNLRRDRRRRRSSPLGPRAAAGAVTGYGPLFDEGAYEQDGHIRIDFGSDAPFLEEDAELNVVGARHVEENVRQLVELTAAAEKASGATARLLWSELGESLAQRLAARLE